MATDASETIIKVEFHPEDSVYDVYEKFNAAVEEAKASEELNSSFDKLAGLLNFIPGLLMEFTLWLIRVFDYFGKLPRILLKLSPFHGSMFVTSMGSLGIPPIYHHCMISAIYRFFSLSVQSEGKISCFPTARFSKRNISISPSRPMSEFATASISPHP